MDKSNEYARIAPFYERVFGYLLYNSRLEVIRVCKEHSFFTLLDIGCGTGEQGAMALSQGIRYMGIEQDHSMLLQARTRMPRETFLCQLSATVFAEEVLAHKGIVDVALCSHIIHEMSYTARFQVLDEVRHCARYLILVEYALPERSLELPASLLPHIPERLAGTRHYACYRDFMERGGIEGFLYEAKLSALTRSSFLGGAIRLVLTKL